MYKNEELYINCDGINVHTKITFPAEQKEKMPVLVLIPGFTGHIEEDHILAIAEAANSVGYVCVRSELYGHGKSDGKFEDHNVLLWMVETMRVVNYAYELPYAKDVYLAGHSQGGLNTILSGGMMCDRLKAILPLSPATSIYYGALAGNFLGVQYDKDNLPEKVESPDWTLSSNYARAAKMLPYEKAISEFDKPVLIVHGDADEAIPYEFAVRLQGDYKDAKLVTIPGANHCYDGHLDELRVAVADFLADMEK